MLIFSLQKCERHVLTFTPFFESFVFITLSFLLFIELGLKVNQGYFVIDGVLFS